VYFGVVCSAPFSLSLPSPLPPVFAISIGLAPDVRTRCQSPPHPIV
jgi:hypothetical protein